MNLCDLMDCSPLGFSARGILQARTLEWVAISSSRGSSRPRNWTQVSRIAGVFFATEPPVWHEATVRAPWNHARFPCFPHPEPSEGSLQGMAAVWWLLDGRQIPFLKGMKCPQSTAYVHAIMWLIEEDLACLHKNWNQGKFPSHKEEWF